MDVMVGHWRTRSELFPARSTPDGVEVKDGEVWRLVPAHTRAELITYSARVTDRGVMVRRDEDGMTVTVAEVAISHPCQYQTNDVGIYAARGVVHVSLDGARFTRDIPLSYLYDACGCAKCSECSESRISRSRRVAYDVTNRIAREITAFELAAEEVYFAVRNSAAGEGRGEGR